MGKAVRRSVGSRGGGRDAGIAGNRERAGSRFPVPRVLLLALLCLWLPVGAHAQQPLRFDRGRFTVAAYPSDEQLARSLLASAVARDTFPGLPRPKQRVVIAIAPDRERFRQWIGPTA